MLKKHRQVIGCLTGFSLILASAGPLTAVVQPRNECPLVLSLTCDAPIWDNSVVALSWRRIWRWLRPKRGSGTIRTDRIQQRERNQVGCLVVPGTLKNPEDFSKTSIYVWHPRPLFVWGKGNWQWVEVYEHGGLEPLWRQRLEPDQARVEYGAIAPLVPNENGYYWQLIPGKDALLPDQPRKSFRIMNETESQEIAQKLQQLDRASVSARSRVKKRIAFFMKRNLGSDAMQEIYGALDETQKLRKKLAQHDFCPPIESVSDPPK